VLLPLGERANNFKVLDMTGASIETNKCDVRWAKETAPSKPRCVVDVAGVAVTGVHPERNREAPITSTHWTVGKQQRLGITTTICQNPRYHMGTAIRADHYTE
jgi:hypothetical protein